MWGVRRAVRIAVEQSDRRASAWRPRPGAICSWCAAQSICSQLGRSLWRTHFACRVSTLRDAGFVPGVVGAEWIMDTDELNTLVTDAIWRAQELESRGVCAAAGAWLEVSSIEEQLAAARSEEHTSELQSL